MCVRACVFANRAILEGAVRSQLVRAAAVRCSRSLCGRRRHRGGGRGARRGRRRREGALRVTCASHTGAAAAAASFIAARGEHARARARPTHEAHARVPQRRRRALVRRPVPALEVPRQPKIVDDPPRRGLLLPKVRRLEWRQGASGLKTRRPHNNAAARTIICSSSPSYHRLYRPMWNAVQRSIIGSDWQCRNTLHAELSCMRACLAAK